VVADRLNLGLSRHSPAAACAAAMRRLPVAHSLG
jgi:hypothetical protein